MRVCEGGMYTCQVPRFNNSLRQQFPFVRTFSFYVRVRKNHRYARQQCVNSVTFSVDTFQMHRLPVFYSQNRNAIKLRSCSNLSFCPTRLFEAFSRIIENSVGPTSQNSTKRFEQCEKPTRLYKVLRRTSYTYGSLRPTDHLRFIIAFSHVEFRQIVSNIRSFRYSIINFPPREKMHPCVIASWPNQFQARALSSALLANSLTTIYVSPLISVEITRRPMRKEERGNGIEKSCVKR